MYEQTKAILCNTGPKLLTRIRHHAVHLIQMKREFIPKKVTDVTNVKMTCVLSINKTLWKRILGRHCVRRIGMYISWESACTSVQGLMIGSTEYWNSLVCR